MGVERREYIILLWYEGVGLDGIWWCGLSKSWPICLSVCLLTVYMSIINLHGEGVWGMGPWVGSCLALI